MTSKIQLLPNFQRLSNINIEKSKLEVIIKMLRHFTLACVLLASFIKCTSIAVANEDSLGLFIDASPQCPFSQEELTDKIQGEFVKARVNPSQDRIHFLRISLDCIEITQRNGFKTGVALHQDIRFGTTLDNGVVVLEDHNRGIMLVGPGDVSSKIFFLNSIKDIVSEALVTYIETPNDTILQQYSYIIQLMMLRNINNAEAIAKDLRKRGYNTYVKEEESFNRIIVLPEAGYGYEQVIQVVEELEGITGSRGQVLRFRPK
ncbi:SPOR domain-containing protein [Vibrio vulnificus]|uniref:SPOR domain-containing protein n=1 Tax=Vibrio vulnificus TaxID=672 RepID=UPI001D3E014C|nr:SPOR domain-containing protein [Vibrio vulnificus]ELU4007680.1 SPOR domain-containing protein [Vibrio vulnificus]